LLQRFADAWNRHDLDLGRAPGISSQEIVACRSGPSPVRAQKACTFRDGKIAVKKLVS
jgi:hypothetical protein